MKNLKIPIVVLFFLISLVSFYYGYLFLGTFCIFMFSYLLGSFKGRKKIKIIERGTTENAVEELYSLFNRASKTIDIVCGRLNPDVYNNELLLNALDNAVQRGVTIRILTNWNEIIKKHEERKSNYKPIIKFILEKKIMVYSTNKDFEKINHFCVIDEGSFRIEKKHNDIDIKRENIVVFNNKIGRELHSVFQEAINNGETKNVSIDELEKLCTT